MTHALFPAAWLPVLERHTGSPATWFDVLVAHDFEILSAADIAGWASALPEPGPAAAGLPAAVGTPDFEVALWAACREAMGALPRPGTRAWLGAQDRWRQALVREGLVRGLGAEGLGAWVEAVYERIGCPEDMLALFRPSLAWQRRAAWADLDAVQRFLGLGNELLRQPA